MFPTLAITTTCLGRRSAPEIDNGTVGVDMTVRIDNGTTGVDNGTVRIDSGTV